MAIASIGSLGTGVQAASATTMVLTTSATLEAGNAGVLWVSSDNRSATGNTNDHSTVVDSTGANTYTKMYEYTYSPGSAAGDGNTFSIWAVKAASQLTSGGTVTITWSGSLTDACCSFEEFTLTNALELAATPPQLEAANVTNPASMTISGLSSQEYIFVRGVGKEVNSTTALTGTANFTVITGTRSRNNSSAIIVRGEYRILTGTGSTSGPSLNVLADTTGIFAALKEGAGGGGGSTILLKVAENYYGAAA